MSDTIEHKGLTFRVETRPDDGSIGAPWDEHDGHGAVREFGATESANKRPGERVLYVDRRIGNGLLYDWQGAIAKAKVEGWGLVPDDIGRLKARLGREPTKGDIRAEAVQRDFDYCRRYASGDWHWCGVIVTLLDVDGEPVPGMDESLWGLESDQDAYILETARELADVIAKRIGRRKYVRQSNAWRVRS